MAQLNKRPIDTDKLYQAIGEFAVSFQWLEHRIREIGWLIDDPKREQWPPLILRDETNNQLLKKVEQMFLNIADQLPLDNTPQLKQDFSALISQCHDLRKYRNNLMHSAYIELKAGGEVHGIMRSNPKISIAPNTNEYVFDQELLTEESINNVMLQLGQIAFKANWYYMQMIHSLPHIAP